MISLVTLSGCATMIPSAAPTDKVYCSVAQPIYWSKNDTDKTIAAVKEANAAWKAICQSTPRSDKLPSTKPTTFNNRWHEGVKVTATAFL